MKRISNKTLDKYIGVIGKIICSIDLYNLYSKKELKTKFRLHTQLDVMSCYIIEYENKYIGIIDYGIPIANMGDILTIVHANAKWSYFSVNTYSSMKSEGLLLVNNIEVSTFLLYTQGGV